MATVVTHVFKIPKVPFSFAFEPNWPNGYSVTKQSLNYHSSDSDKVGQTAKYHSLVWPTFPEWLNSNSVTVLSLNCHSAVQSQTQTEPEAYRMHCYICYINNTLVLWNWIPYQLVSKLTLSCRPATIALIWKKFISTLSPSIHTNKETETDTENSTEKFTKDINSAIPILVRNV